MARSASSRNVFDRRSALIVITFCVVPSLHAAPAGAADEGQECIAHNDRGNELRLAGQLLTAKTEFWRCAAASCPKIIREECTDLVARVEASTPTLVIAATDGSGKDVTAAAIYVDGVRLPDARPGQALAVDPGSHRLRVVAGNGDAMEASIVAHEGEKNRTVRVELPRRPPARVAPVEGRQEARPPAQQPRERTRAKPPAMAWVLGSVGVAALGSFAYFAISAESQTSCAPRCSDGEADEIYRKYLLADISLGVSVVALGVATYLFLKTPSKPEAIAIGIQPAPGGVALGTRFAF
jgi:hypothetical protein